MKTVIETERLILREMTQEDLDFLVLLMSNPKVMKHFPKLYSRQEVEKSIERNLFRYKIHGHSFWILQDKASAETVGQLGLIMQVVDNKAEPEIGYQLLPQHWHKGYATEAAVATRDYAFEKLKYPYVISLIRPVNLPSQAVAKRVGMQVQRKTLFHNMEHLVFRIDKKS